MRTWLTAAGIVAACSPVSMAARMVVGHASGPPLFAAPPIAGPPTTFDGALARDLLRELVETDTTPAQGSTKAAEAMAQRLRSAGYGESEVLLLGARPERQNLVVRLRGRGMGKPILLIAHLDVVDAPREGWSEGLEPFRLTERDGFFYGRGVLDIKHGAAGLVASLIRLRAEGYVPQRDILVALTADEEGGPANGVGWLLRERPDLMDVAYCLNLDAGGGQIEKGKRQRLTIQTCEKVYLSVRLEARSPGGHSSLPTADNAIYRLAAGLTRLAQLEFPFRFNETTRAYFERLSQSETGAAAADLRAVAQDPPDVAVARRVAARSALENGILHTTCVATRLQGGHADNALPQSAQAIVNCRLFPGDTAEFVRDQLVRALADPEIQVTPLGVGRPSPVTPLLPEVLSAVEKLARQRWPGVPILPSMDPWASDSTLRPVKNHTHMGGPGMSGDRNDAAQGRYAFSLCLSASAGVSCVSRRNLVNRAGQRTLRRDAWLLGFAGTSRARGRGSLVRIFHSVFLVVGVS